MHWVVMKKLLVGTSALVLLAACKMPPEPPTASAGSVFEVQDNGYKGFLHITTPSGGNQPVCSRLERSGKPSIPAENCTSKFDLKPFLNEEMNNADGQKFNFGIGSAGGHGHALYAKCDPACPSGGPYDNLALTVAAERFQIPHYPRPFEIEGNKIVLNTVNASFLVEGSAIDRVSVANNINAAVVSTVTLVRSVAFQVDPISWKVEDKGTGQKRPPEQAYLRILGDNQLDWARRGRDNLPIGCTGNDLSNCDPIPAGTVFACAGEGCTPTGNRAPAVPK